ncbi:MAG: flagellar filament outer layer protein FlaA [Treponema sp.]
MRHGGLIFASVVAVFLCTFFPLSSQQSEVNYQTYMVDTFDNPNGEWSWHAVGSKFVTENFPVLKFFDGMPRAVKVMNDEGENAKFLGVEVKFNRRGDNWLDIVPSKQGDNGLQPYEIPFKGEISRLDLWVWGVGYYYDLEVLVRDCYGRVHTIPVAPLNFKGWKNLSINVPKSIPQRSAYLGAEKNMKFVAFRVRTRPTEHVEDFYIFIDQFKALTNVFVDSYDGYELATSSFGAGEASNNTGNKEEL